MKKINDGPMQRYRITMIPEEQRDHNPELAGYYDDGYASMVAMKAHAGYAIGDIPMDAAIKALTQVVGMFSALIDNVDDDTAAKVHLALQCAVNNDMPKELAYRVAHAYFGQQGTDLCNVMNDDDADPEARKHAALKLAGMIGQTYGADND